MNLGQARTLVRMYINEPKAAHWSDAELNGIIQEANREIWLKLCAACPNWLADAGQFTFPAGQSRLFLPTVVPATGVGTIGTLVKVLGLFIVNNAGEFGPGNIPIPMRGITRLSDLYQRGDIAQSQYVATVSGQPPAPWYAYCLLGTSMYIYPVPQSALILSIFAVSTVATPTSDAHELLVPRDIAGTARLLDHHELVPLLASVKAKTAVGDPDNGLTPVYQSRLRTAMDALCMDQQQQDPTQVRGVRN